MREACRALAELGFVELIAHRGVFVKKLSREDAIEVYDLRAGLTGLAAQLLAPMLTPAHLAQLQGFVDEMELAAEAADFARFYPLNLEFHDYIVRATGNARLMKLYRGLVKEFHLFRRHGLVQRGALLDSNREHRDIVAAIAARDSLRSYDVGARHVGNGKARMLRALDDLAKAAPERQRRETEMGTIE